MQASPITTNRNPIFYPAHSCPGCGEQVIRVKKPNLHGDHRFVLFSPDGSMHQCYSPEKDCICADCGAGIWGGHPDAEGKLVYFSLSPHRKRPIYFRHRCDRKPKFDPTICNRCGSKILITIPPNKHRKGGQLCAECKQARWFPKGYQP